MKPISNNSVKMACAAILGGVSFWLWTSFAASDNPTTIDLRNSTEPFAGLSESQLRKAKNNLYCLPFSTVGEHADIDRDAWHQLLPHIRYSRGDQWLSIIGDEPEKYVLRQRYVASPTGSPHVSMAADVPHSRTYRVSQSIYFEPGFVWGGTNNQTGKIGFGLAGGSATSGGKVDPAGFTARWIWRGDGRDGAQLAVYSYASDRPDSFGEDIVVPEFTIPLGKWVQVVLEVSTNSAVNESDGTLRAWVNGKEVLERQGITWQSAGGSPVVDSVTYASFYGGNDSSWAPSVNTSMRVKDVCFFPVENG